MVRMIFSMVVAACLVVQAAHAGQSQLPAGYVVETSVLEGGRDAAGDVQDAAGEGQPDDEGVADDVDAAGDEDASDGQDSVEGEEDDGGPGDEDTEDTADGQVAPDVDGTADGEEAADAPDAGDEAGAAVDSGRQDLEEYYNQKLSTVEGVITGIDPDAGMITILTGGGEARFMFDDNTRFQLLLRPVRLASMKAGSRVAGLYKDLDGGGRYLGRVVLIDPSKVYKKTYKKVVKSKKVKHTKKKRKHKKKRRRR